MAQHMLEPHIDLSVTSKVRAVSGSAAVPGGNVSFATPANYASNTAIDARLTAIDGTLYSQAKLDTMTQNDKVYALRMLDDPTTV